FEIVIEENLETRAHDILEKYYYENMKSLNDFKEQIPPLPAKKITPVLIVLALLMIHLGCEYAGVHKNIILEYGSSALYILQGEYYRIFTALMLHADIEHLAGNIAGILIFGIPLCTITGSIQGFCLLAASGAAGNLINAWMYRTAHLSIGASTSVMGAAGLLVAFQMKKKAAVKGFKPSIFLPLGAGAALVGMLSGGENTDVSAHIFGFASGLVMGGLVSFFVWIKEAKQ
ncbi:MAG: rhomboid family intramembrane serine protease, partial [Thermodesulfobacteriota bacterium]|nr:rhomboid family intramembrane serine protease [Thermodesulfobacteriota bacterium]